MWNMTKDGRKVGRMEEGDAKLEVSIIFLKSRGEKLLK